MAERPPQTRPRRRRLGTFDRAQVLTAEHHPYNIVTVVRLSGAPERGALEDAVRALVARHPMLRARITGGRERAFEVAEVTTLPLERRLATAEDEWISVVEDELIMAFDFESAPLGRATLLVHERKGAGPSAASDLVLAFPHALVDGIAVTQLVKELLELLSGADLEATPATEQVLPASSDKLFPRRWQPPRRLLSSAMFMARQMGDELGYRLATRGRHSRPPVGPFTNRIIPLALTRDETTALVRESRRHRVSVVATLEAAMLIAVAKHCYPGLTLPHRYCAFPLLRQYLEPPVGDDAIACYITVLRLTTWVSEGDELWRVAARINNQLDRSMRRGERFLASLWSHVSMRTIFSQSSHRMATTALSYTGALALPKTAGHLEVREVHAFVSNFPIGPQYTAQSRLFGGRLWIDVLYLDSDLGVDAASAIGDEMRRLLTTDGDQAEAVEPTEAAP